MDEPTIGLDPVVKEQVRSLIQKMNRELHMTIFLTSHDIGDIEKLCRRVIIVNAGQIVLDAPMEQLKARREDSLEAVIMDIYQSNNREGVCSL